MPGDTANATASLEVLLVGLQQVLAGLQQIEDKLTSIKGMAGGISLGGGSFGGQGGGASSTPGGVGTSRSGSAAQGNLFGDTAGPAASSTQWNPPSAQADMNLTGMSHAGVTAGMPSALLPMNAAIMSAIPGQNPLYTQVMPTTTMAMGNQTAQFSGGPSGWQWQPNANSNGGAWYPPPTSTAQFPAASPANPTMMGGSTTLQMPAAPLMGGPAMSGASFGNGPTFNPGAGYGGGPSSPWGTGTLFTGGPASPWSSNPSGNPPNSNTPVSNANQPSDQSMMSLIALHYTLRQYEAAGAVSQGIFAQHIAGGAPMYGEQFVPSNVQMALSLAGLSIGARFGQPILGAAAGTYLGQSLTTLQTYIDRDILQDQTQSYYTNAGLGNMSQLPINQLKFIQQNLAGGTPIPASWANNMQTHVTPTPVSTQIGIELGSDILGGAIGAAVGLASRSPIWGLSAGFAARETLRQGAEYLASGDVVQGIFAQSAKPDQVQSFVSLATNPYMEREFGGYGSYDLTRRRAAEIVRAGVKIDPQAALNASAGIPGLANYGARAEAQLVAQRRFEAEMGLNEPFLDIERSTAMSQSSGAVASFWSSGAGGRQRDIYQRRASILQPGTDTYAKNLAAIQQLDFQSRTDYYGMKTQETNAFGQEGTQTASQRLQGYLLTGGNPNQASTGDISDQMNNQASSLMMLADTLSNPINEAQRAQLRIQAKDLSFQASYTTPRNLESEQISFSQTAIRASQSSGLGNAQYTSVAGSANNAGSFAIAQAQSLREQADLNQRILDSAQYRTAQERETLSIMVSQAQAQARILDYSGAIANAQGAFNIATTGNLETSTAGRITLLSGAGGAQAGAALGQVYSAAQLDVKAAQALVARSGDPNSAAGLEARQKLASAMQNAVVARENQADVPYSGYVQAERYQLQGAMSAIEAGLTPSGPGDIRRNLARQMELTRSHIADIDHASAKLSQSQGGHLDPAQAQEFSKQRSEAVSELSQQSKEFNYGYMDRLISMAYNLPQQSSWYLHAMFSNREASQAGVLHPSIGGTRQQMQQMSALGYDLRHIASAPGAGSAAGFNQQAAGQASGAVRLPTVQVPIEITDSRTGNVLARNDVIFENGKSVSDFRTRTQLGRRLSS